MVSKDLFAIIAMDISVTSLLKNDTGHDDLGDEKLRLIHVLVSNYALKEYSVSLILSGHADGVMMTKNPR